MKDILNKIIENQKEILKELSDVRKTEAKILKKVLKEEEEIKQEEELIKKEEEIIEEEEDNIEDDEKKIGELLKHKVVERKYSDVLQWKKMIWESCEYKHEELKSKEISYRCKKLNGKCTFTRCPLNIY